MARHGAPLTLRDRIGVGARILAGTLGAYAFASVVAAAVAPLLPLRRDEAVTAAALIAVVACPVAVMWAFAARTAGRAWIGLVLPGAALALAGWLAAR